MKIKCIAAFIIASLSPHAAESQQAGAAIKVDVTLDRPDWKYPVGDSARFTVTVTSAGRSLPGVKVGLTMGEVRLRPMMTDTVAVGTSPHSIAASLKRPGFVRLTASARIGDSTYRDTATAAFDPEKIVSATSMPADFEQFWRSTIAAARRIPLEPTMTKMVQRSTPEVDVYHISFKNDDIRSRIYGILSVPTKPGKYPAVLTVPGAGARPYFPDITLAKRGIIRLSIGIHGIPVDRDSLLYNELRATALAD